ncbi:LCP family protein [Microbacterium horticulturae]|uniref:LCP family protein n=1 Tax=Microbacterium horticulturae TaxID=3028316 RepID=A0ABY8C3P9_9MICO|nr:LCP family protein [Microbacterium sp. KACC 23027]WEG09691.1 LCP family protein [Microbacterium sp. KACC 23027]
MSRKLPRVPLARHGRLRSPRPLAQIATFLAALVAVVVVGVGGTAVFATWSATDLVQQKAITLESSKPLPPSIGEIEGGVNLLLVGTDSCEGQDVKIFPRCAHDDGGERNDVTMLVHIGDDPRRVTVVSFPRDMIVPIPSCPSSNGSRYQAMSAQMLNSSYEYGGLACTALTVENLSGVDIQFAAAIRWTGVINMSDAIGGVKVCVAGDINDSNTGLHLKAGEHTLKGTKALQFLRIRHGIGDGSDLGRISNQQQFMSSLVRKLQSGGVLGDPTKLFALATTALQQVSNGQLVLDENLANPTRMVQIAMAVKSVPYKDIVFVQYPTGTDPADESRVLPITSAADTLFAALKANKALNLTGKASPVNGVDVTGTAEASPGPSASPSDDAVDLPSSITGSTAAEVTCTQPQH